MADQRTYTGGRFTCEVNGANAGYLKKFSGLSMEADIAEHNMGGTNLVKKNVANIKWTAAKADIGIGMGKEMYQIIHDAFNQQQKPFDGTLNVADFNYKVQSIMNFHAAIMTSVTVPKLDGSSKDAAYFSLEWEAEQVRWLKGDGSDIRTKIAPKQKAWLASNFRVEIGGLPCSRIASVDSFTWKCSVSRDQIGINREPTLHPAKVTVPDIKLSISMADYEPWAQAAKKWFVDGEHLESNEMTGSIVFLNPNMKDEIGRIDMHNLGFKKFSKDDLEANKEAIARFSVELYCEKMDFKINYADSAK